MKYSEKLNGYWESENQFFLEFRDESLTVRDQRRRIMLETGVSYDADKLDSGERTVIMLEDNKLSSCADGSMMTGIKELAFENDELSLLYYHSVIGETGYKAHKTEAGPFDHVIIRDDEFLDSLQGVWEQWTHNGVRLEPLVIEKNTVSWLGGGGEFHVVSYRKDISEPKKVFIVPADLTSYDFGCFTAVEVRPDMLLTNMIVTDVAMPLTVFAREEMLDKIEVPSGAKLPVRNTMQKQPEMFVFAGMSNMNMTPMLTTMGMMGFMGMTGMLGQRQQTSEQKGSEKKEDPKKEEKICSHCGHRLAEPFARFCSECGAPIPQL